jgi:cytochrome c-type biogenesis protein CcmH/NrfG
MKKEGLMMLIAGVVLGAVLGFIGTRQYYVEKMTAAPPAQEEHLAQQAPQQGGQAFDPAQHEAMLSQMKAELATEPKNAEKRILLANAYYDVQKFAEAAPLYEEVLKLTPDNADVMVDLGVCYRNMGRYDDAVAMFERALKVEPDKKQALFNEVVVYQFDKGDKAKAKELFKRLEAKYGEDPLVKKLAGELAE